MTALSLPRMLSKIKLALLCCILAFSTYAQSPKFTLSGTIKDSSNGETLIGASIFVTEPSLIGTTSNEYGFYSLQLPEGNYRVHVQYIGYNADTLDVDLHQNQTLDLKLNEASSELQAVTVLSRQVNENILSGETGVERVNIQEINKLPVLFGERDLFKSIQLLPGIKANSDGSSGFSVRGGAIDQNLILLDEAPVYNAAHLLGFFSTFNSDAVRDVMVYKGTQPAHYGGRLSSVVDVRMKEGNNQAFEGNASIGLITSRLSAEGPIVKDRGSFFVSARRTYADMILSVMHNNIAKKSKLYFYDLNAKVNYRIGEKDIVYLSGYTGRDKLRIFEGFGVQWGNATATLRWNHIINNKWFSLTSFILSDYDYLSDLDNSGNAFLLNSRIRDYNLKQEFQFFPTAQHSWRLGLNSIYHAITPGEVIEKDTHLPTGLGLQDRYAWENALYGADEWECSPWLNINAGLRFTSFSALGKGDFYTMNEDHEITDTVAYAAREMAHTYFNLEPRVSASFIFSATTSIKVSYTRNAQYLHLISNNIVGNPSDKWISSNNNIRPEIADQVSLGYFQSIHQNTFEFSVDGYYKYLQNQLDYKDGADVFSNNAIETELREGTGRAYGVEMLLKKRTGKLTGWLSYTLSRTEKKIEGINNNNWYPARQDRTHDISVAASYDVSPRLNLGATWTFRTGNAATLPSGKYHVDEQVVWLYTERNGYRLPDYHRLDLGAAYKLKSWKHMESELSLGVYNAYGQQNAFSFKYEDNDVIPGKTEVIQMSLFRWVPALSLTCKFK